MGEELGWRGFALPRLQARHGPLAGTRRLALLLATMIPGVMAFTWLYNRARGSLLPVVLLHGMYDYLAVSEAAGDLTPAVMSMGLVIRGLWAIMRYGRAPDRAPAPVTEPGASRP